MRREIPERRLSRSLTLFILDGQCKKVKSLNKTFRGGEDKKG